MNYKTLTGLQNLFKSVVRPKSSGDFFAWLGNAQGTVVADDNNGVYIMDWNGNVRVVMNNKVPPYPFRPVRVGYVSEASKVLEVKEFVDAYPTHRPPHVPNHAGNHEWGGVDTMFVRGEQILPGVAIPDDDDPLVLHVAGFVYYLNGWHIIDSFTLDVTSYIPSSGAKFLLLEADDAGAITVQSGTAVDIREELVMEDIPSPTLGKVPLVAVMVYAGQVKIWKTLSKQDVVDLRWSRYATGLDTSITAPLYAGRHVAAADPTVTDDDTAGFLPLHLWLNSTSGDRFVCTDNSTGAAVWTSLAGGGGGGAAGISTAGRLSLASATPVITSEQADKTTLYFTPFRGNKVTFLDGTTLSFSELSLSMSAWDKNCLHDIFRYNNSGAVAIEGLSWGTGTAYNISAATAANPVVITFTAAVGANPFAVGDIIGVQDVIGNMGSDVLHKNIAQVTAIGGSNPNWTVTLLGVSTSGKTYTSGGTIRKINNARATDIVLDDGTYIKNADDTRVYLGSVFIDGNGYCQDTLKISGVWNYYNRVDKSLKQSEATASWSKSTATITPANNSAGNRLTLIVGIPEDSISVDLLTSVIPGTTSTYGYAGIGEDTISNFTGKTMGGGGGATSAWFVFSAFLRKVPTAGIHFYSWNERSTSTNTSTFYGEGTVGGILDSGLEAVIKG
jgi:hypothetical protein